MAGTLLESGVLPAAWIGDGPQPAVTIGEVALARVEGEQIWLGVEAL